MLPTICTLVVLARRPVRASVASSNRKNMEMTSAEPACDCLAGKLNRMSVLPPPGNVVKPHRGGDETALESSGACLRVMSRSEVVNARGGGRSAGCLSAAHQHV